MDYFNYIKDKTNDEYILLNYNGYNEYSLFKHKKCNNKFSYKMHEFVRKINSNKKCPFCEYNTKNMTKEMFSFKLENKFPGQYTVTKFDNCKNITVRHNKCNYEFKSDKYNLIDRKNEIVCKRCSNKEKHRYEYIKKYIESFDGYLLVDKNYINSDEYIEVYHKRCKSKYKVTFHNFKTTKTRCPICYKKDNISKGEKFIEYFLDNYTFLKYYKEFSILKKRFDFLISEYNLLIEYDGEQHFKKWRIDSKDSHDRFLKNIKNDIRKNKIVENSNYSLIRIPYNITLDKVIDILFNLLVKIDEDIKNLSSTTIKDIDERILFIKKDDVYIPKDYKDVYSILY